MTEKPQRKPCVIAYDWNEVQEHIEKKYSCNLRDFAGKFGDHGCREDVEYQDFWHWIIERNALAMVAATWVARTRSNNRSARPLSSGTPA